MPTLTKVLIWRDTPRQLADGLEHLLSSHGVKFVSFKEKFDEMTTHDTVVADALHKEGGWIVVASENEGRWPRAKVLKWKALNVPIFFLPQEVCSKHQYLQALTIMTPWHILHPIFTTVTGAILFELNLARSKAKPRKVA